MRIYGKSTRFHERIDLSLPVQVFYRENSENEWMEETSTEEVTICGIGFFLSRPVELHRLVRFKLAMPIKFRLFDYGKPQYEVWGIIRHIKIVESLTPERIRLLVGSALIGAHPAKSFLLDPQTRYDLKPILRDKSFWQFREMLRKTGRYVRADEDRRQLEIPVVISIIDEKGLIIEQVQTKTLNVSESGTAVLMEINSFLPKFVLIKSDDGSNSLLAGVRGIHRLETANLYRLHLEFISDKWSFK